MKTLYLSYGGKCYSIDGPIVRRNPPSFSFITEWDPSQRTEKDVAPEDASQEPRKATYRDIPWDVIEAAAAAPTSVSPARERAVKGFPKPFRPGFNGIVAHAGKGKTRLARALARALGLRYISWGEPEAHSAQPSLTVLTREANKGIRENGGFALDSMKALQLMGDANLGRGGLSKAPLLLADSLSAAFAAHGIIGIGLINPYDLRADDLEPFANAYAAACTSIVLVTGSGADRTSFQMRDRQGDRSWHAGTFEYDDVSGLDDVTPELGTTKADNLKFKEI